MCENETMRLVETLLRREGGGIKQNNGGGESS
jgi:hypothetical protein